MVFWKTQEKKPSVACYHYHSIITRLFCQIHKCNVTLFFPDRKGTLVHALWALLSTARQMRSNVTCPVLEAPEQNAVVALPILSSQRFVSFNTRIYMSSLCLPHGQGWLIYHFKKFSYHAVYSATISLMDLVTTLNRKIFVSCVLIFWKTYTFIKLYYIEPDYNPLRTWQPLMRLYSRTPVSQVIASNQLTLYQCLTLRS